MHDIVALDTRPLVVKESIGSSITNINEGGSRSRGRKRGLRTVFLHDDDEPNDDVDSDNSSDNNDDDNSAATTTTEIDESNNRFDDNFAPLTTTKNNNNQAGGYNWSDTSSSSSSSDDIDRGSYNYDDDDDDDDADNDNGGHPSGYASDDSAKFAEALKAENESSMKLLRGMFGITGSENENGDCDDDEKIEVKKKSWTVKGMTRFDPTKVVKKTEVVDDDDEINESHDIAAAVADIDDDDNDDYESNGDDDDGRALSTFTHTTSAPSTNANIQNSNIEEKEESENYLYKESELRDVFNQPETGDVGIGGGFGFDFAAVAAQEEQQPDGGGFSFGFGEHTVNDNEAASGSTRGNGNNDIDANFDVSQKSLSANESANDGYNNNDPPILRQPPLKILDEIDQILLEFRPNYRRNQEGDGKNSDDDEETGFDDHREQSRILCHDVGGAGEDEDGGEKDDEWHEKRQRLTDDFKRKVKARKGKRKRLTIGGGKH